jgi:hypothetical protein
VQEVVAAQKLDLEAGLIRSTHHQAALLVALLSPELQQSMQMTGAWVA